MWWAKLNLGCSCPGGYCPDTMYDGVGWVTGEEKDKREKRDTKTNITKKWQGYETKIVKNIGKIAGYFCIVIQMN